MGGWLNFSSDHVEPIKADHGTQPPPPTSSTFFRSLFISAPRAGLYPPSLRAPALATPQRASAFSFSDLPSSLSRALRPLVAHTRPSPTPRVLCLPPRLPPLAASTRSLARSLAGNSLDFFASRGGVIYLAELERGTHRGGGRPSVRGEGSWVTTGYVGYQRGGERERRRVSRQNRWWRQR